MLPERLLYKHPGTPGAAQHPSRPPAPLRQWEVGEEAVTREKVWHSAIAAVLMSSLQMEDPEFHIILLWFV